MNLGRIQQLLTIILVLILLVLVYVIFKELKFYLVPLTIAAFLAMLMLPLNRWLEKKRLPRMLAILISLLIILTVIGIVSFVFTSQIISFTKDIPEFREQILVKFQQLQEFVEQKTGMSTDKQVTILHNEVDSLMSDAGTWGGGILKATGGTLISFFLFIVHFILLLLYRGRIKRFFLGLVPAEKHQATLEIIERVTKISRQYLTGVVTVMAILSVLNSTGLMIIGLKNAIFFGVMAAVLNVIPYVGIYMGAILATLMAIITKDDSIYIPITFGIFLLTHLIDSNFLTPRITGSQVKINALATLGAIIIGELVWGVVGMVLFVPLTGILKIFCESVPELKPFAILIGDDPIEKKPGLGKLIRKPIAREPASGESLEDSSEN